MTDDDKMLPAEAPAVEGEVRGKGAADPGAPHEYDTDAQNLGDFKQKTATPKPDRGGDGSSG